MIKHIEESSCAFLRDLDLLCFSHLRWGFVFQRPQHLIGRFAKYQRVFFIEEPIFGEEEKLEIELSNNVRIVTPHFTHGLTAAQVQEKLSVILDQLIKQMNIRRYYSWYYTPMALPFTRDLTPELTIYDCMDELSAFKFAPPALKDLEKELIKKADVVFTGGQSLYEAKKNQHHNIYPFPSSIDYAHFLRQNSQGRTG